MAVELGLKLDLSPWKKGIRDAGAIVENTLNAKVMTPFDRAVKRSTDAMKKRFQDAGKEFSRQFDMAGAGEAKAALGKLGVFTAVIAAAVVAAVVAFERLWSVLMRSVDAFRAYDRSVVTLRASLQTLGSGVDTEKALKGVEELGSRLRLALGIAGADTNRAFADFVTRGFSLDQARQLTILAANYAKKTGKPLEDVSKKIADAANGSVDAIKDLGLQVSTTESAVWNAEAAVLALKAAYGSIGDDLTTPSERLAAAWDNLAIVFGSKLAPILEPLISKVADFVVGLTSTKEGEEALKRVAGQVERLLGLMLKLLEATDNVVTSLASAQKAMLGPSKGLAGLVMSPARAMAGVFTGGPSAGPPRANSMSLFGAFNHFAQIGAEKTAAAREANRREIEATRGQTFAGNVAHEKDTEKAAKDRAAHEKKLGLKADVGAGSRVTVNISAPRSSGNLTGKE